MGLKAQYDHLKAIHMSWIAKTLRHPEGHNLSKVGKSLNHSWIAVLNGTKLKASQLRFNLH
jgi:hypothetical protein